MKNLLNIRTGALVLGLVLAFAGSAFTEITGNNIAEDSYWFSTDVSGNPQDPLMNEPACDAISGVSCAKLYQASDIEFDGNGVPLSVIPGHEQNQTETRLKD